MTTPFTAIAVELRIQATELARVAEQDEQTVHAIGLSPAVAHHIIEQRKLSAALIGEAHRIIKALAPVENTVRGIISETGERI